MGFQKSFSQEKAKYRIYHGRNDIEFRKQAARTWYGLQAEIDVENRFWHHVKVGGIPFPHPPMVNLILRRGLPDEECLKLSYLHEFGHLQTFPLISLYAILLVVLRQKTKVGSLDTGWSFIKAIVALQAVWELASEGYVLAFIGREYRNVYQRYPNPLGRSMFWSVMSGLAIYFTLRAENY